MYLSAKDIEKLDGKFKTHFLNPQAIRVDKSLGDAVGLKNLGVHIITVAPGNYSTEFHVHHYEEECIYVLSGTGKATIGTENYRIAPGDFIGWPTNGVAHDMFNDGDEPLVCLVVGQRLAQDITDYPRLDKRLYRNSGQWDLVDQEAIEHIKR